MAMIVWNSIPKSIIRISLIILVSGPVYTVVCQQKPLKELNRQMLIFYQQGKFDSAIQVAEEMLRQIQKQKPRSYPTIATAHYNIGLLRKKRFQVNHPIGQKHPKINRRQYRKTFGQNREDHKIAEKEFRKVFGIYDSESLKDSMELASAKSELAWLLYNSDIYLPHTRSLKARINRAEKLYSESVSLFGKLSGKESDETISSVFSFALFHEKQVAFEMSLPLYKRFVGSVEKKYGPTSEIMIPALWSLAGIYVSSENLEEAQNTVNKISRILGRSEKLPEAEFILNKRLVSSSPEDEERRFFGSYYVGGMHANLAREIEANQELLSIRSYKRVLVRVACDESGKVISAEAQTKDRSLKKTAEKTVLKWKIRPFEYQGRRQRLKGYLSFVGKFGPGHN